MSQNYEKLKTLLQELFQMDGPIHVCDVRI